MVTPTSPSHPPHSHSPSPLPSSSVSAVPVSVTNFSHPVFRSAYGARLRVPTLTPGPSMCQQSFKDECDINRIMARYLETGSVEHVNQREARYQDVTGWDYQEALNIVAAGNSTFAGLPASVRDRFENDPKKLLDFVHDPANVEECIRLGFLDPERLPEALRPVRGASSTLPTSPPAPAAPEPSTQVPEAKPKA